ncbi:MAG: DNA repair protein RecO [Candidatus Obscuribacter phosphatis]|uniref:DNA repair protein RecO n=1 Tax=Candidatus Obscuribacter phosphatis TaxID=1906157 RepID=A0A8J7PGU8_9BACT|nr:DNA repair protein RecO [Candidatus Obscuribacter phosphatis]
MTSFTLNAVNIGTFPLGEADRIVVLFSAEKGLHRAVAKGARKPGSKMSGKSEPLNICKFLLAKGKSLDIITQCETLETFPGLRSNLERLTYALYFAELSQVFGADLGEDSQTYFERLSLAIAYMAESETLPILQCLEFEMSLLNMLGLLPELTFCVSCRNPLEERTISTFNFELGGVLCEACERRMRGQASRGFQVAENARSEAREGRLASVMITPMVWQQLVLARSIGTTGHDLTNLETEVRSVTSPQRFTRDDGDKQVHSRLTAAQRLLLGYIEYKSGRRMRSLDVLGAVS